MACKVWQKLLKKPGTGQQKIAQEFNSIMLGIKTARLKLCKFQINHVGSYGSCDICDTCDFSQVPFPPPLLIKVKSTLVFFITVLETRVFNRFNFSINYFTKFCTYIFVRLMKNCANFGKDRITFQIFAFKIYLSFNK